jgi:hypothetical protein
MCDTFAYAIANFLTHFIISIAVLENVPPDADKSHLFHLFHTNRRSSRDRGSNPGHLLGRQRCKTLSRPLRLFTVTPFPRPVNSGQTLCARMQEADHLGPSLTKSNMLDLSPYWQSTICMIWGPHIVNVQYAYWGKVQHAIGKVQYTCLPFISDAKCNVPQYLMLVTSDCMFAFHLCCQMKYAQYIVVDLSFQALTT